MTWSEWFAVIALLLSIISIIWQLFAWWHSQPRIEVKVFKGYEPSDDQKKSPMICIQTINHGDKDITLHKFALESRNNRVLMIENKANKLEPRNCHTVYRLQKEIVDSGALNPYIALVFDATGKKYKSKPTKID